MKYFIDFEATQFSNEIISIGCVREDGATFYSLVNPKKKLTQFIINLTGITDEMLREAPEADVVFKRFFDWCAEYENDTPVFYCYGSSDVAFVKTNARKSNNLRAKSILCYLYSELYDYEPAVKAHFGLIQSVSLVKVASYYRGEELQQVHNALEDAKMLKYVYDQTSQFNETVDMTAFPEYRQVTVTIPNSNNETKYTVYRLSSGKVIQTFESLNAAAKWVFDNRIPDNDQKKFVQIKNLARNIRHASATNTKYMNNKWKVVEE